MNNEILHSVFLEEITQRITETEMMVDILADILSVSQECISEKLKGETPFTFYEVMLISRQLNISLDTLEADILSIPQLPSLDNSIESINPAKTDFALQDEMISILKLLKNEPNASCGEITNILPQPLYIAYENMFKYYTFKWNFQSKGRKKAIPFKDIIITDEVRKKQEENVKLAKNLHTEYILDHLIFNYLVSDIKYFRRVKLITDDEVEQIKQDLFRILNQIDTWSKTEVFEETGKKINIYISNVYIDTSYIYMYAPNYQLTIAKAFLLNGIASTEKITFEELKHWIQSIKLQSTLITGCNEKERIKFLEKQHAIINSLSQP